MKIFIPSFKRSDKQRTLGFLTRIKYPKNDIYICVQTNSDYAEYKKYESKCNVLFCPAASIAQNRNNILSYMHKGERALMLDDNINRVCRIVNGEWCEIKTANEFDRMVKEAFDECDAVGAKVFCTTQNNNLLFLKSLAIRHPYQKNRIGGCFFGITKTDILFDERFKTKEDYDFLLTHISKGDNTVRANCIGINKTYKSKGGCFSVHTDEIEKRTTDLLVSKYPNLVERVSETDVRFINDIEEGYESPRWTGEIADCSLPVTLDTYNNCSFGCVYCFSQYQKGNRK